MSDIMMVGVLAMPYELAMATELGRRQYWDRAQQALERIAALETENERLRAELVEAQRDAARYRWLGHDLPSLDRLDAAIERVLAEVDRLRTELAEATRDAERYRWLRGDSCADHSVRWTQWEVRCWEAPMWTHDLRRDALDAAIDRARGAA